MSRELENDLRCLKFTLRLPLVERDETLPNGAECVICKEPYGESFEIRGPEIGCQLPCNCIIGHLCAWNHFAPSKGAHVTCPVCHVRFLELNKIDEGVFSPPTKSSRQKHEVEVEKQLEQLAYATDLHLVTGPSALDASMLKAGSEVKNVGKETVSTESGSCPGQVNNNAAKSTKPNLLRRSSSRRLSVARAAVKVIDMVAKRSG